MKESLPRYVPRKRNYRESPAKRRRLLGNQVLWTDGLQGSRWMEGLQESRGQRTEGSCRSHQLAQESNLPSKQPDCGVNVDGMCLLQESKDQCSADTDQRSSDIDQTSTDQRSSDIDQRSTDIDQHPSGIDQRSTATTNIEIMNSSDANHTTEICHFPSVHSEKLPDIVESHEAKVAPRQLTSKMDTDDTGDYESSHDKDVSTTDELVDQDAAEMTTPVIDHSPRKIPSKLRSLLCCIGSLYHHTK